MKRRTMIKTFAGIIPGLSFGEITRAASTFSLRRGEIENPFFRPNWESLRNYSVPDWFRDAKFGMWAHWGPQCQAEYRDWWKQ